MIGGEPAAEWNGEPRGGRLRKGLEIGARREIDGADAKSQFVRGGIVRDGEPRRSGNGVTSFGSVHHSVVADFLLLGLRPGGGSREGKSDGEEQSGFDVERLHGYEVKRASYRSSDGLRCSSGIRL